MDSPLWRGLGFGLEHEDERMRRSVLLAGMLWVLGLPDLSVAAPLQQAASPSRSNASQAQLAPLQTVLQTPESQIDLAQAKLVIDRMIDPTVDVAATLRQLDGLAARIKARFPVGASSQTKLELLVTSLSQPGAWNDHRPFRYDLADPFGRNIRNKLLSTYLATRQGNCVSMPVLLVVLGQKLGLDMTLATAPEHVLAKFRNDEGQWINIEATSFGTKRDSSYQQEMGIAPRAIASGIYLRPLSRYESVAVMMATLMEFYGQQGRQESRIAMADLVLQVAPNDVVAMLQKGNAYFRIMQTRYLSKYRSPEEMSPEQRIDFDSLQRNNHVWFERAEALGWAMPTRDQDLNYLKSIQGPSTMHQGGR